MPADVVDGRRAIIQPVGQRCNLVKWSTFCKLFESAVNISNSLFGANYAFSIQFKNIFKHAVRSGMCGSEVQCGGLPFNGTIGEFDMMFGCRHMLDTRYWMLDNSKLKTQNSKLAFRQAIFQTCHHPCQSSFDLQVEIPFSSGNSPFHPHSGFSPG